MWSKNKGRCAHFAKVVCVLLVIWGVLQKEPGEEETHQAAEPEEKFIDLDRNQGLIQICGCGLQWHWRPLGVCHREEKCVFSVQFSGHTYTGTLVLIIDTLESYNTKDRGNFSLSVKLLSVWFSCLTMVASSS